MAPELLSYVAGGAGDEHTQRANVEAFHRWGLVPRMLVGGAERDLSVTLFGSELPTPLLLAPVGVIGICTRTATATSRRPGRGRDRRADGRLDPDAGPDGGRRRRARRHARLVPAVHARTTASWPRASSTGPRPPGTGASSSPSTPGPSAGGRAT